MGRPMTRNLARAGFELVVHDADAERLALVADEVGARGAAGPDDFAGCGVVVTMLPDDSVVRRVTLEWGLARALPRGSVLLDMSSSNPIATRRLAGELAELGLAVVDAPVSGGVPRAENATLAIMAGGDPADVDLVEPVLRALGDRIFRTGAVGSGHAMKALNNLCAAAAYAAAAEALAIGARFDLAPETMVEVLNASTGRSFVSELVLKEHVLTGAYATGFTVGLLAKDVAIAADLAEQTGVDAPATSLVARRWADALAVLGPAADHSEAHRAWPA